MPKPKVAVRSRKVVPAGVLAAAFLSRGFRSVPLCFSSAVNLN